MADSRDILAVDIDEVLAQFMPGLIMWHNHVHDGKFLFV